MKPTSSVLLLVVICSVTAVPTRAQAPPPQPPPPVYTSPQLEQLVATIALYPDPLLAQVLTGSTFSTEIPDADGWARAHSYLTGDALARAISEDNLPWDPSVIALLPFPAVLDRMAGDMAWTDELGNAVLADRASVMDAVQDQRARLELRVPAIEPAIQSSHGGSGRYRNSSRESAGDLCSLLRSGYCFLPAAARFFHRRRDYFRSRDFR
jgi:hypothetical protein